MDERRNDPRMLCADLVEIRWKDKSGRKKKSVANLEDISLTGASLQMEESIPSETVVKITYPKGEFTGLVKYCIYREIGYFLGVEFDKGMQWSQQQFKPQHLLDPRRLAVRTAKPVKDPKTIRVQ